MLKWAGGKKKVAKQLRTYFPKQLSDFREPFFGGNSLLRYLGNIENKWVNDKDPLLVNYYIQVRDNDSFYSRFLLLIKSIGADADRLEQAFLSIREKYQNQKMQLHELNCDDAVNFLFLNRLSFRQILHQSRNDYCSYDSSNISGFWSFVCKFKRAYHKERASLQGVRITCSDYRELMQKTQKETFLFLDPPYVLKHHHGGVFYSNNFSETDQERLATEIEKLPCRWMMTIDDSELTRRLFRRHRSWEHDYGSGKLERWVCGNYQPFEAQHLIS